MIGTVEACRKIGYSEEQAELIGKIDDLFEKAIELNLLTGDEAIEIGKVAGTIMGKHTGKIMSKK